MVEGTFFMLGLGALCGIVLGAASRIFYVWEDPRIAQVEATFAGANCGGCGYAGCAAAAVAVTVTAWFSLGTTGLPVYVSWAVRTPPRGRRR